MKTRLVSTLVASMFVAGAAAAATAPVHRLSDPSRSVTDGDGRRLYIVDLHSEAIPRFKGKVSVADRTRFHSRHSEESVFAALALERKYGFRSVAMTSYVGYSVSAYLTAKQVERLRRDVVVESIAEASRHQLSSSEAKQPHGASFNSGGAISKSITPTSWGVQEVGSYALPTIEGPRVYVLDSGVAYHADLPEVARYALRIQPNGYLDGNRNPYPPTPVSAVGCYSHATHVAGIIGAGTAGAASRGVAPGVRILSVSAWPQNAYELDSRPDANLNAIELRICGRDLSGGYTDVDMIDMFDWVKAQHIGRPHVAIVNFSQNFREGSSWAAVRSKMHQLSLPDFNYRGAVIVQSAGNGNRDACEVTYGTAQGSDGIIVVGGLNQSGARAVPFVNALSASEPGSNFGPCVEVFGPSTDIVSTFGRLSIPDFNTPSTLTREDVVYNNYGVLSGTSMAAPHVAGVAAVMAYLHPELSPAQLEELIRSTAAPRLAGPMPQLPDLDYLEEWLLSHFYSASLHRPIDSSGKAYWLSELLRLRLVGADPHLVFGSLVSMLFKSSEYQALNRTNADFVQDAFVTLFDRPASPSEISSWTVAMQSGLSRDAVLSSLLSSSEFRSLVSLYLGAPIQREETVFSMDIYRAALSRLPDSGGLIWWRDQLRVAQCNLSAPILGSLAGSMVKAFFLSPEYVSRTRTDSQFVGDLYQALFKRAIDVGGYNFWSASVGAVGGREVVIDIFLGSPEWQARVNTIFAQGCLRL